MATNYITFGKDRYHQHPEMEQWCRENIGAGRWINESAPKTWQGLRDYSGEACVWTVHSMFGNTTFAFRRNNDYTLFLLKWT